MSLSQAHFVKSKKIKMPDKSPPKKNTKLPSLRRTFLFEESLCKRAPQAIGCSGPDYGPPIRKVNASPTSPWAASNACLFWASFEKPMAVSCAIDSGEMAEAAGAGAAAAAAGGGAAAMGEAAGAGTPSPPTLPASTSIDESAAGVSPSPVAAGAGVAGSSAASSIVAPASAAGASAAASTAAAVVALAAAAGAAGAAGAAAAALLGLTHALLTLLPSLHRRPSQLKTLAVPRKTR